MNDFHGAENEPKDEDVLEREELVIRRHLVAERLEVDGHERGRTEHESDAEEQEPAGEHPAEVWQHPLEQPIRVVEWDLDVEDVGQRLHPLAALTFLAA